jgi:hypothetical protein
MGEAKHALDCAVGRFLLLRAMFANPGEPPFPVKRKRCRVRTASLTPATKIGGKIYLGQTHRDAFCRAEDELGGSVSPDLLETIEEGFVNSKGEFLSREEARAIASAGLEAAA